MNAQIMMPILAFLLFCSLYFIIWNEIRISEQIAKDWKAYCKKLTNENESLLISKPKKMNKTLDELIAETKGKFFSVTFTKKDGSVRTINGKDKYRRLLAGGTNRVEGLGYVSFVNRNAAGVKTPAKGNWACAHKQEVLTFKCGKIKAEFMNI
jgi:hypothetical protein